MTPAMRHVMLESLEEARKSLDAAIDVLSAWKCRLCGKEVEASWQFCPYCGQPGPARISEDEKTD